MVRNSKAKIRRVKNKYDIDLSVDVDLQKLTDFKTRKQYNQWKEDNESFRNRNNRNYQFVKNDSGVVSSVKRLNKIKKDVQQVAKVARDIESKSNSLPFFSGGKLQGTVGSRKMMEIRPSTLGIREPKEFDFNEIKSSDMLDNYEVNMERRKDPALLDERMLRMKDNFISILEFSFNSDSKKLVEELKTIPADDFYEIYLMFDEFDFALYDSDGDDVIATDNHLNIMMSYIERYKQNGLPMELKDF